MAEVYIPNLLDAQAANQTGNALNCVGLVTVMTEVVCVVTAATLAATVTFTQGIEPAPNFPAGFIAGGTGTLISNGVAGYSFSAGTAVLTIANPAIGRTSVVIRWATPARFLVPVYAYGSGGGTVQVRVAAWGFQQNTTP